MKRVLVCSGIVPPPGSQLILRISSLASAVYNSVRRVHGAGRRQGAGFSLSAWFWQPRSSPPVSVSPGPAKFNPSAASVILAFIVKAAGLAIVRQHLRRPHLNIFHSCSMHEAWGRLDRRR